jgi:hypothetical protein
MPSLDALAGWESAVLASLRGAKGTIEERDRQITRAGLYAEYPAIVRSYLDLLADDRSAAEALKRAVFIVWLSTIEPSPHSGISELPEGLAREVMQALDDKARVGALDDEFALMLGWYRSILPAAFELYGADASTAAVTSGVGHHDWRHRFTPAQFSNRGQLGMYWQSLLDRASG